VAHIQKRAPHRYRVRYRSPDGRERSKTFSRRPDAVRFASSVEADIIRGTWRDPRAGRRTLASWADEYFEGAIHKRATTLARDRSVYGAHIEPQLGAMPLAAITPLDLRRFVEDLATRFAPASVRTYYGVLRAILNAAVDVDLIVASPCRRIRLPTDPPVEKRRLSPIEITLLAQEMPNQYRPMVYLAGVLGLRWQEIAGLRVSRVDLLHGTIRIVEAVAEAGGVVYMADVKSARSRRMLDLPPFLRAMLAEHMNKLSLGPDDLLFRSPTGGPLRPANYRNRIWNPAVRRSGLDGLTFHGLRHSAAGLMREVGAQEHVVQTRLGHGSPRVTSEVYGWITPATSEAVTRGLEMLFTGGKQPATGESIGPA